MSQSAGRELDTWRETQFGVTREFRVRLAVVQQVFRRDMAVEAREEVLSRDSVAGLVEEDVAELRAVFVACKERQEDDDFGNGVEGAAVDQQEVYERATCASR